MRQAIIDHTYEALRVSHTFSEMAEATCKRDITLAIQFLEDGNRERISFAALWTNNAFLAIGFPEAAALALFKALKEAFESRGDETLFGNATIAVNTLQGELDNAALIRDRSLIDLISDWHITLFSEIDAAAAKRNEAFIKKDGAKHLEFIKEAGLHSSEAMFIDYCEWANSVLNGLSVETVSLVRFLITIRTAISLTSDSEYIDSLAIVDAGIKHLSGTGIRKQSNDEYDSDAQHSEYLKLLLNADRAGATALIHRYIDEGMSVRDVYLKIFQNSQYEIGKLWEKNQISVAQEHYCTATTQMIMSQLYPKILNYNKNNKNMVATCVGNELHEIGLRMVADFLEMEGWNTYYLGANMPADAVISALRDNQADLLAISVTMTPHLRNARKLIEQVRASDMSAVKIIVGGYPFCSEPELWKKIGADGFATQADQVEQMALNLVS